MKENLPVLDGFLAQEDRKCAAGRRPLGLHICLSQSFASALVVSVQEATSSGYRQLRADDTD